MKNAIPRRMAGTWACAKTSSRIRAHKVTENLGIWCITLPTRNDSKLGEVMSDNLPKIYSHATYFKTDLSPIHICWIMSHVSQDRSDGEKFVLRNATKVKTKLV